MTYSLLPSKRAAGELASLPRDVIVRVDRAILVLTEDPRPPGCKKLKGKFREGYRIRVGDYRVLYLVDDTQHMVSIYRVGHRRGVYD